MASVEPWSLFVSGQKLTDITTTPQLLEPDKCEGWVWKTLEEIKEVQPEELFLPILSLLKQSPNLQLLAP